MMRRRDVITLFGGVAAAWPMAARAQAAKLPTVGLLNTGTAASQASYMAPFVQRLRELSWIEGRTVSIEQRFAEGRSERFAAIAAELVRLKVDVIVAGSTPGALAAKQATSLIPIVFAAVGDPVGSGLVASLARPGGNITGLSQQQTDTAGKRLELLREVVPRLRRLAILLNPDNPAGVLERDQVEVATRALGLDYAEFEFRRVEDIAPTFEALKGQADALYVCLDPVLNTSRIGIGTLAAAALLPTMHDIREFVDAGGLMSYGPSFPAMYRRTAELVDKILRGTRAGDIPVEQPTKFDLVINLTTAKALGLTVPPTLLALADEVIE
jgi:putative tryptophan/tyrosine transport system substrate-binding protein